MATVARNATLVSPRRHYIANNMFYDDFFSYTVSSSIVNGAVVTTGSLGPVVGAYGNCPMGRILRENGKKLYPDSFNSSVGVTEYLVGVYDSVSFLNGYINPNSPVFVPMNTDKPYYLADGNDLTGGNDLSNQGPAVYTRGDINADGDANIGGNLNVTGVTDISGATTLGFLGSAITFIKSGSAVIDSAGIDANAKGSITLGVQTGCISGKDFFIFENPADLDAALMYVGFTVTNTAAVTVYLHNTSDASIDPIVQTWKYTHIRFA